MQNDLTLASFLPALPEIYLTTMICVVLMVDVFFGQTRKGLAATFTQFTLLLGAALTAFFAHVTQRTVIFDGLYVADASVMPTIPAANTNLPTIVVAERIAAWLGTC